MVLVSVRVFVCLLRERSALESGEGIIVYIIYLILRRPTKNGRIDTICILITRMMIMLLSCIHSAAHAAQQRRANAVMLELVYG